MLTPVFKLKTTQGERILTEADFPIVIGGGTDFPIAVADLPAGQHVAYIGVADGRPFVQPAGAGISVWHNRSELTRSTWLSDGDRMQIGRTVVVCSAPCCKPPILQSCPFQAGVANVYQQNHDGILTLTSPWV